MLYVKGHAAIHNGDAYSQCSGSFLGMSTFQWDDDYCNIIICNNGICSSAAQEELRAIQACLELTAFCVI